MSLSFWRYSHLVLALFASALIALASVTGIILACEPVADAAKGYRTPGMDTLTLARVVPALRAAYPGIQRLSIDGRGFASIKWTDAEGAEQSAYVDAATGRQLEPLTPRNGVFEWTTNLHRSLFLHETGRIIMGVAAGLLVLIIVSGIGLLIQRQKGLRRFFAPIERTGFSQYNHIVSGRVALFFILALALTGGYLSVSRFVVKPVKGALKVDTDNIPEEPLRKPEAFPVFLQTRLADLKTLDFPFSEFPEDYFTLKTSTGEQAVNQFTGDALAAVGYPDSYRLAEWSLAWHTGQASVVWSVLMAIASGYVLFFIYTGFAITIQRRRGRIRNKVKAADAEIVILVGSENGSTIVFAKNILGQLLQLGRKAHLAEMNTYREYPSAAQLIVMTSTHGLGDPPANAKRFPERVSQIQQQHKIGVSVLGFGSRNYPQFCKFAADAEAAILQQSWAAATLGLMTVNDRSLHDFGLWLSAWSEVTGIPLLMDDALGKIPARSLRQLSVVARGPANDDGAFSIRLRGHRRSGLRSGDLLAIYPAAGHTERLYSIARIGREIHLSVRLHPGGLGSGYLYRLNAGEKIRARIIRNASFHFPASAPQVILIGNGTGVAPFQGMIAENRRRIPCTLYAGFRTVASYRGYERFMEESRNTGRLRDVQLAYSREAGMHYVSHLLDRDREAIGLALQSGAVFMICGSLSMHRDVCAVLDNIHRQRTGSGIEALIANGQIRSDCY